jgi:hypothetical protein
MGAMVAACSLPPDQLASAPGRDRQPGEIEVFLEPDPREICAVTVTLRNLSEGWRGEARLELAWMGAEGRLLHRESLSLDGLLPGRLSAKNLSLPFDCGKIDSLRVQSARWHPYPYLKIEDPTIFVIDGVDGTTWRPVRDDAQGLLRMEQAGR